MYSIETKGENLFALLKDGEVIGEFLTFEDAQKAQAIAEGKSPEQTGTWVDDGAGVEYPKETDNYHSGDDTPVRLSGEARIDALVEWLRKFGMHVPYEIAPKE
jgi:hypothetical protein